MHPGHPDFTRPFVWARRGWIFVGAVLLVLSSTGAIRDSNPARLRITKVSGDGQWADASVFLPKPLVAAITGRGDTPKPDVPVVFKLGSTDEGYLATAPGEAVSSSLTVVTDSNGQATVWYACPPQKTDAITITARAGKPSTGISVRFTASVENDLFPIPAPSDVMPRYRMDGSVFISWKNNDNNTAARYEIERSTDNVTWLHLASLQPILKHIGPKPPAGRPVYFYIDPKRPAARPVPFYIDPKPPAGRPTYYRVGSTSAQTVEAEMARDRAAAAAAK